MNNYSYKSKNIDQLLKQLQSEQINGILVIKSQIDTVHILSSVLVWKNGGIVYGNSEIITGKEIAKKLLQKLNPKMVKSALKLAVCNSDINDLSSARQFLLSLAKIRALTWEKIEASIQTQVASIIEQISLYPGTARLDHTRKFDLSFGEDEHSLNWSSLNKELKERQQKWLTLSPYIPAINAIPKIQENKLALIAEVSIRNHLQNYIDGKHSLMAIAAKLEKDPLNVAHTYYNWSKSGWISFENHNSSSNINQNQNQLDILSSKQKNIHSCDNLSIILSVDDSLIVQMSIKRALQGNYQVMLSDSATDALNILNQKKVDLLLLDVTMPDINGLDMCRTLRSIPKFKNLPIVMVTARDTLIDKMKGQIAGTNNYLTKPFDKAKLLEVIHNLIGTNNHPFHCYE